MVYVFDGSYYGFLSCVFECFEMKEWNAVPVSVSRYQPSFFDAERTIVTDAYRAERVLKGLNRLIGKLKTSDFFRAFLSEDEQALRASFRLLVMLFRGNDNLLQNYGDDDVLYVAQTLKKVNRERHRMKAFVRFRKSSDGLFFALVEPDFNVLPLITSFFAKRYADQCWLIYDIKRNYGIYYDRLTVTEVVLDTGIQKQFGSSEVTLALDEKDAHFEQLWKQYFKSTNIQERRNIKLHLQHLPKRYWKYLTEKQP